MSSETQERQSVLPYQSPHDQLREGWLRRNSILVMRLLLLVVAIVLFSIAYRFGLQDPAAYGPQNVAPNIVGGLASAGFSFGGGMALLAMALIRDGREKE